MPLVCDTCSFRHNWAVEHHGKWAEPVLPAAFYPTFACGAGHILSVDMVSWLTDNRFTLHAYQVRLTLTTPLYFIQDQLLFFTLVVF